MSQNQDSSGEGRAAFGFRDVPAGAKQGLVNEVFSRVADRYDLMNDLMSGGLHRIWKDLMLDWLAPPKTGAYRLLDMAGGTGDIALRFLKQTGPEAHVVLADISAEMLRVGEAKITQAGFADRCDPVQVDAQSLPFSETSFDGYTIGFGIRNVTDIAQALREAYRVLRPGGRFLCLEFSEVQVPMLDRLYDLYSMKAIPAMGAAAAGDAQSYQYLVESIRRFPAQEAFADMIREAGFEQVKFRDLSGGIAALHSGWRL